MFLFTTHKKNPNLSVYIATFLSAFHIAILAYITSSFLNQFIPEKLVGSLYVIGSLASIAIIIITPVILRLFGNYFTIIAFTILEILILLGMAFMKDPYIVLPLFIAHWTVFQIIFINMDVFFESSQKKEADTGSRRGLIMTMVNSSFILAALTIGFILNDNGFWKIYLLSATVLVPFLFIVVIQYKNFKDPIYERIKIIDTLKKVKANKSIFNTFIAQFFLKFFFSWMVVYLPIYLHDYIGFSWSNISIIFTIMLLPFVIFELPAGKIADKWLGEKELLSTGFIIIAIFTSIIPFISTVSFITWAILLFITRIGASLVEITTESHFFKHVKAIDADMISFFRLTLPLAYIAGPVVAIIALQLLSFQYIFLVLGIIMLAGLKYAFALKDTH